MTALLSIIFFICMNIWSLLVLGGISRPFLPIVLVTLVFVFFNIKPLFKKLEKPRYTSIRRGVVLLESFLIVLSADIIWLILLLTVFEADDITLIVNSCLCFVGCSVIFWNGITRTYIFSSQLGLKWRVIGIIFGWVFPVDLFVLIKIIKIASAEYKFENQKALTNVKRAESSVCATRYPLLLVHGVFFRDFRYFNYWGRIPEELEKNGAVIFYGNQQSALSVKMSAAELASRIEELGKKYGKVNIIAHSKGGLDSRYAISCLGSHKYVASLTTVNTPHRGCQFADYLLEKAPQKMKDKLSSAYNTALKKLGDPSPDFMAAVSDLTASACEEFNKNCPDAEGVFYQSIGSVSKKAVSGRFPLNLSYLLVKYFDGPNDGLVSKDSMVWGSSFRFFETEGDRGISHGDMIDLNRENFRGFDVREAYVEIVHGLKEMGY